ncbi:MAG: hypothetical protein HY614_06545 [Candidatus Rokubacteria bacterium]|nr:hypothetical protein [Candidatus Rokubacteria bacterium]
MAMPVVIAVLAALVTLAAGAAAAGEMPREPRQRVEHHVRQADELAAHFDEVLQRECPRFATRGEWQAYLDSELDRLVLLTAHVEQAWAEARATGDDEVRRAAKAPRRRLDGAQSLVDKFQACAADHGAEFHPGPVWARIQREVPRRRAEITLPK